MTVNRRDTLKMLTSVPLMGAVATAHAAEGKRIPGKSGMSPGSDDTLAAQIGELNFDLGLPTPASVTKLYDTMDFQRASLCYLWAIPIVGSESAKQMLVDNAGARSGELVLVTGYREVSGMLGSNVTTPYVFAHFDLSAGPIVIEYPQGATSGSLVDWWDRPITDVGVAGPDAGKGATFVMAGPDHQAPQTLPNGAKVLHSRTNKVLMFTRGLDPDLQTVQTLFSATRVYAYGSTQSPTPTPLLRFKPDGALTGMGHPSGLAYWQRLASALHGERVEGRDRFFAAMLQPLGLTYDGVFKPDARQQRLLEAAAKLGEATAKATAFYKRIPGMRYRDDTHWEYLIPQAYVNEQDVPGGVMFEERTAFFYEITGTSAAVLSKTPGVGAGYLAVYHDKHGAAFDGAQSYRLRVPADVPAKLFWSITLYDIETRGLIQNAQQIVDRSSRQDLHRNADGTIDIVLAPTAPAGLEKNWIPTAPGRAWYVYFRLFGPLEPYFQRTWVLPDIEPVRR